MSLGKVPVKVGGGSKRNVSLEQGCSYQWQPLPGTITLKNSAEVRTNLQTHQGQQQEREGAPEQDLELETTADLPEGVHII